MAKIFPFRGIRYNPEKVDLSQVVTQPYDKISSDMQEEYYRRSPYNIVRVILNKKPDERRYEEARENLERWLNEEILIRDDRPTIYAHHQDYEVGDDRRLTRKGFIALFKLSEYGKGILPHERTLEKPKEDRLKLMRATRANLGQIFVLYSDPKLATDRILDQQVGTQEPLEVTDSFDPRTVHRLWPIQEEGALEQVVETMRDKTLFIADGHHRYETALAYRDELSGGRGIWPYAPTHGPETYENVMLTFVNMDDRGLTIFPTHRLIHELRGLDEQKLETELSEYFELERIGLGERERLLKALQERGDAGRHSFGLYLHGLQEYYLLTLQDEGVMDELVADRSPEWRRLEVTICHQLLLDRIFGIAPDAVEGQVGYRRSAREALELVEWGKEAAAILLNPTKVEEVRQIAWNGERMPQKSTDFYPKILTGLVLNKLCFE